ncbi:unnamed protein product [Cylindrotheca closterium]|uniref:CHK kinase-like domain-containing protein n=1 Tax=Cylindrotheca closterium TaxID=2856 RepID=A0AAD2JKF4_9STRA|nr:unnamed protein product [Cylindrotheca closterium]
MEHPMPQWLDSNHMDPKWVEKATGISCRSCVAVDISNEGRKSKGDVKDGATLRLTLDDLDKNNKNNKNNSSSSNTSNTSTLVVKQVTESQGTAMSKQLGLAREALFYSQLSQDLPANLFPKIHYSYGNYETGEKCVIMEDLENAIDSGVLFGPGNPNNWKRDLPTLAAKAGNPSSKQVAMVTFVQMAKVHATYWKSSSKLLTNDKSWLRGQDWLQGQGQDSWKASQGMLQNWWKDYLEADQPAIIKWDPKVQKATEKAMNGISWESQLERLHTNGHWTLVHGDFWPGNIMWMILGSNSNNNNDDDDDQIKIIDWEMVGLGSGPQELGQYVISNMDPAERRASEKELVQAYYKELQANLEDEKCCSWEYCWSEYKIGGVERWLWFLVYFIGNGMGDWAQFFHDQISEFMNDHNLSEDDITQPRP